MPLSFGGGIIFIALNCSATIYTKPTEWTSNPGAVAQTVYTTLVKG